MAPSQFRDSFSEFGSADSPFLHPGSASFGLADTGALERTFVGAARLLRRRLLRLSDYLANGDIDVQNYVARARVAVRTAFFTAYSVGTISVFPFYTLTDRDVAILDKELNEETGFLRSFAHDIARGEVMDPRTRAGLYLLSLRGVFELGRVEAMPVGPFRWQLGPTEHCTECFQVAADGPYQREKYSGLGLPTLPGLPGDGSICLGLTRCGCRITLATGSPVPNQELADRLRGLLLGVVNEPQPASEGT